jgi:hypothetical protein
MSGPQSQYEYWKVTNFLHQKKERKKEKKESLQNAVTSWNITVIFSSNRS